MGNKTKSLIASCTLLVLLSIGVFTFAIKSQQVLPSSISKQVTSSIYLSKGPNAQIDKDTLKYDRNLKQLSYVAKAGDKSVIVSEQPSPDEFSDIPAYFSKWIEGAGKYTSFESSSGKVYLARNSNYGSNSIGIMNEKGTLLFAKPSSTSLTDDEWKQFFLTIKPN